MADAKISALTELAATPAVDDVLPIVDTSVGITKKITTANLMGGVVVPVKATGAELDTGTDDAKFSTAKALKDSHNVPSVVPGTSGNYLKSDGTDWTSASALSVPVKATGAELDTGTDDAKFSTAKALKDSHNVPSVIPSTSGNVLTSNGTDWTSAAAPAGGDALMVQIFS
jgi:hypothetical protein